MSDLTPEVLARLARLDKEATRGPWEWDRSGVWHVDSGGPVLDIPYPGAPADGVGVVGDSYPRGENRPTESMELIAAMRNALPALLAAAQRVQETDALERLFCASLLAEDPAVIERVTKQYNALIESENLRAERSANVPVAGMIGVGRLRAKVAELEGDRERLNWLDTERRRSWTRPPTRAIAGTIWNLIAPHGMGEQPTLRDAIDAARQAGKEEG